MFTVYLLLKDLGGMKMFHLRQIKQNIENLLPSDLEKELYSIGIQYDPDLIQQMTDYVSSCFEADPKGFAGNIYSKPTYKALSPKFDILEQGMKPGKDFLVVCCFGNDNLNNKIVDTIIKVQQSSYRYVIFFTTKWDMANFTGKNMQRLYDLLEHEHREIRYCFLLLSIWGLAKIPLLS
jgi:hypothetical protein